MRVKIKQSRQKRLAVPINRSGAAEYWNVLDSNILDQKGLRTCTGIGTRKHGKETVRSLREQQQQLEAHLGNELYYAIGFAICNDGCRCGRALGLAAGRTEVCGQDAG